MSSLVWDFDVVLANRNREKPTGVNLGNTSGMGCLMALASHWFVSLWLRRLYSIESSNETISQSKPALTSQPALRIPSCISHGLVEGFPVPQTHLHCSFSTLVVLEIIAAAAVV